MRQIKSYRMGYKNIWGLFWCLYRINQSCLAEDYQTTISVRFPIKKEKKDD
jgi:hypothetical protein|tara:strand:- start:23455 stop:23607 length:153 start_codon:yes stop_codon:yes gene_type:complete